MQQDTFLYSYGGIFVFNKKFFIVTLVIGAFIMLFVGASAFSIFNKMPDIGISDLTRLIESSNTEENAEVTEKSFDNEAVETSTVEKIAPSTKMVYQYYYIDDEIMEEQEDVPTYFLIDLTLEDMLEYYPNWHIITFSSDKVVMRKNVKGKSNQRYILGEKDGYLAVFYEEEQDGISLREMTDVPISTLPKDEQVSLKEGIFILGDQRLVEALQNYES